MPAYFCAQTGVRLVEPGVSKTVDPANGKDLYAEPKAKGEKSPKAEGGSSEKPSKAEGAPSDPAKAPGDVQSALATEIDPAPHGPGKDGKSPSK